EAPAAGRRRSAAGRPLPLGLPGPQPSTGSGAVGRCHLGRRLVEMNVKRLQYLAAATILSLPFAWGQTAPDLFVFEAGTPIRASEMNHNFKLLQELLSEAFGATGVDVAELAAAVGALQAALDNGDLDGANLE